MFGVKLDKSLKSLAAITELKGSFSASSERLKKIFLESKTRTM